MWGRAETRSLSGTSPTLPKPGSETSSFMFLWAGLKGHRPWVLEASGGVPTARSGAPLPCGYPMHLLNKQLNGLVMRIRGVQQAPSLACCLLAPLPRNSMQTTH